VQLGEHAIFSCVRFIVLILLLIIPTKIIFNNYTTVAYNFMIHRYENGWPFFILMFTGNFGLMSLLFATMKGFF